MIDASQPLRTAYYQLLNGNLLYNNINVPVSDDLKKLQDSGSSVYVLLSTQDSTDANTMQSWDSEESIVLDIVFKASARSNKQVVDNVAGQILGILFPSPGGPSALPRQTGIQINCVRLDSSSYLTLSLGQAGTLVRRLLTFKQHVRQTLDNTPMQGIKGIINVKSVDFSSATDYDNPDLVGKLFELFNNDTPKFLEYGVDWEYLETGGFRILLANFDATLNNYNIYVLLK
jgi:hypothetical protein